MFLTEQDRLNNWLGSRPRFQNKSETSFKSKVSFDCGLRDLPAYRYSLPLKRAAVASLADVRWNEHCIWWERYHRGDTPRKTLEEKLGDLWQAGYVEALGLQDYDEAELIRISTIVNQARGEEAFENWVDGLEPVDEEEAQATLEDAVAETVGKDKADIHYPILVSGWRKIACDLYEFDLGWKDLVQLRRNIFK